DRPPLSPVSTVTMDIMAFVRAHLVAGPREWDYTPEQLLEIHMNVKEVFKSQPTLLHVYAPIKICGDIHGQYNDLLHIFQNCGWPYLTRYLFLGDYIDRGTCSLEVITLLFACKIAFPNDVYLLRGNHEIPSTNKSYGFWTDLRIRYPNRFPAIYESFSSVFALMPLAAVVNDSILALHGGIAPKLNSLKDIADIKRPLLEPAGLAEDILWSDPCEDKGFAKNVDRGCSFTFGEDVVAEKCDKLGIKTIVRAHQQIEKGYQFFAKGRVITLFSAPGYDAVYDNVGSVMKIDNEARISFFTFSSSPPITRKIQRMEGVLFTNVD
ncbi:hypothetical protein PFISCL1PPCAC_18791, partial [Pristionchus fissidentatus]